MSSVICAMDSAVGGCAIVDFQRVFVRTCQEHLMCCVDCL